MPRPWWWLQNQICNIQCRDQKCNYYGLTSLEFKDSIISHRQSFREKNKQNATALSSFIWSNELNKDYETISEPKLKWQIMKKCNTYKAGDKHCDLCLSEKVIIIKNINYPKTINKKLTSERPAFTDGPPTFRGLPKYTQRGWVTQPFTHAPSLGTTHGWHATSGAKKPLLRLHFLMTLRGDNTYPPQQKLQSK